jgi:hypothetical protein
MSAPDGYGCKRHADLKGNPRLFRQHSNRSESPEQFDELLKETSDLFALACKVSVQVVLAAEVGLVAVRESATAFAAFPQTPRRSGSGLLHGLRPPTMAQESQITAKR